MAMKTILTILKYTLLLLFVVVVGFCALNWRNDLPLSELKQKYANSESKFVEIDGMQLRLELRLLVVLK